MAVFYTEQCRTPSLFHKVLETAHLGTVVLFVTPFSVRMHMHKAMTLLKIAELEIQSVCCLLYSVHGVISGMVSQGLTQCVNRSAVTQN